MRKAIAVFFVLFLALGVGSVSAQIRDIDGTWDISWDVPQGFRTMTVTLHREGMTVTGTARIPAISAASDGETTEVAITDGAIDEDHLTFSIPLNSIPGREGRGTRGNDLQFNAVVGLRGVMGGLLTGEEMIEGTVTGAEARTHTEVPFTGLMR